MKPYLFHITPFDLAFLVAIIIGINFSLLLGFSKRTNQAANQYLALALLICVLWTARVLAIDIGLVTIFPRWGRMPFRFSLALGPLIYFYVLKISRPEFKLGFKDLLHFSPLIPELFTQLAFQQLNPVFSALAFISVITYLYFSHRLIERFYQGLKFNDLRDRYRYGLRWLNRLLTVLGLLWLLWIPFSAVYYDDQPGISVYYPLYLLLMGAIIWIAIVAHSRPEAGMKAEALVSRPSPTADLKQKRIWLKRIVKENRYYLDTELSLTSLAEKLGLTTHELSRIINTALKKSFNDFINEYRVAEVAERMQDPAYDHLTLMGIAYDSGFNSQSTFHRAFKELTGKTPAEYKKELPFYNLTYRSRFTTVISRHETTPKWSHDKLNRHSMFRNYLKVAWRITSKNKLHSLVNIAGLAGGMAVAILIGLWIFDELSFDKYYKNYDRIAQVMQNQTNNGEVQTMPNEPFPLGAELAKSYGSDFTYVSMATGAGNSTLSSSEKKLTRSGVFFEPQVIKMLELPMIKGNWAGLNDPASIMLSESVAKAFFGDSDPMNQVMKIDDKMDVKVTGIYEDQPSNTTFADVTFIAPWSLLVSSNAQFFNGVKNNWGRSSFLTYVQLADHADMARVSEKIRKVRLNKAPEEATHKPELFLQPMSKWHLNADFKNGVNVGGRIEFVWIFGVIGVFVLLLACINFMNLSTAQSEKRSMEVGIRKTFGSLRSQLILQFLCESLIIVAFAFVLSLVFVRLALPFFNELADKKMAILWSNPVFWISIISFSLITGLISGSYPAIYLSSFMPVKVLNRTLKINRLTAIPRKILVVVQFTISIVLIIGTIIVFRQIQFAKNRPMGYHVNGLVAIRMMTPDIHKEFNVVRDELKNHGAIVSMAESGAPTTAVWGGAGGLDWRGKDPNLAVVFPISDMSVDFGKTIGWQFMAGRDFSKGFGSDSSGFVINETAMKYMGLKNPIGETITWNGAPFHVVGVIKDMVVESPYQPVQPSIFHLSNGPGNIILVKLNPKISARESLSKIEAAFKKYNPSQPFDFQFVDEEYGRKFIKEERIGKLAGSFAAVAVLISCLGLFAMASFMTEKRMKEIGIRKVLGASVFNLWRLLSKDFIALVLCSILIAFPISFILMHNWIQKYQYRTEISWWVFIAAGIGAILITLSTVSYKCIKAAIANPVKSLKND